MLESVISDAKELAKVAVRFREEEVTMSAFAQLNDADLKELGVCKLGYAVYLLYWYKRTNTNARGTGRWRKSLQNHEQVRAHQHDSHSRRAQQHSREVSRSGGGGVGGGSSSEGRGGVAVAVGDRRMGEDEFPDEFKCHYTGVYL